MGMRLLLLLLLRMTAVLRGGLAGGQRRMGGVRRAAFLMFHMAAAAAVAFVDGILPSSCVTFSMGMVVMQSNFHVPIFPRRGRGGGRTRGE